MGLGTSAATIIILIGLAGAIALAYPSLESSVMRVSDAFRGQADRQMMLQQTSLQIDGITFQGASCAMYNITIGLNNTGDVGISLGGMSFFHNGTVLNTTGVGVLAPRKTINITYENMSSATADYRVVAVTKNGVAAWGTYACP